MEDLNSLNEKLKVRVYWNLTKKCWSVLYKQKVIGYCSSILLKNPTFIVSERGRQRVIKQKRKNVHAFVEGTIISFDKMNSDHKFQVSYNPYKHGFFLL